MFSRLIGRPGDDRDVQAAADDLGDPPERDALLGNRVIRLVRGIPLKREAIYTPAASNLCVAGQRFNPSPT
jgi:hypothetical protein